MLTIQSALESLGVRPDTLGPDEREQLRTQGLLVLENVLDRAWWDDVRTRFEETARSSERAATDSGTRHVELLGGSWFRRLVLEPRLLAAVHELVRARFLAPTRTHGRDPRPGFGQQGLHRDWSAPSPESGAAVVTALALLDEFTPDNGATRFVPGTHRSRAPLDRRSADPSFVDPAQVTVTAPAGSVVLFHGHLLHSGTRNRSEHGRRVLQFGYLAHAHRRDLHASHSPAEDARDERDPAVRFLLGLDEDR